MERGKYVTRSAFQKVAEENKKLKADIKTLVMGSIPDKILLAAKYKVEFDKEQQLTDALKEIAKNHFGNK